MKRPSYVESKLEAAKQNKVPEQVTSQKNEEMNNDYDSYFSKPKISDSTAQKVKINSIKGI